MRFLSIRKGVRSPLDAVLFTLNGFVILKESEVPMTPEEIYEEGIRVCEYGEALALAFIDLVLTYAPNDPMDYIDNALLEIKESFFERLHNSKGK